MGGTGYKGKFCTNPIQFIRLPTHSHKKPKYGTLRRLDSNSGVPLMSIEEIRAAYQREQAAANDDAAPTPAPSDGAEESSSSDSDSDDDYDPMA